MLLIAPRKQAKTTLVCLFVIFGFSLQAFSQCPTIINSNPVICIASGSTISNLDNYANDLGGGISWWDAPIGGFQYVDTQLLRQRTYYADDDTGSCGSRSSVTIDFIVNPTGQSLDGIFCDIENATVQTYIDEVLSPIAPIGGSVLVYTNFALTNPANPATVLTGATNYYIVFVDSGGCEGQLEFGSTAIFASADTPTPPPLQVFCSANAPTVGDLNSGTTGSVSWYNNIDVNGDPIPPALSPATPLINGNTYYVQVDDVFCPSQVAAVLVQIDVPVDAGNSAVLDYCEDAVPVTDFNLFAELGGSPSTSGIWTGPLPTLNGHLGTVNISTLTAGTYVFTYTIISTGACPDASSTVTIIIHENLSSGLPLIPVSFCVTNLPSNFDLFTLLINEDPNGVWTTGTTGTGTIVISPIDLTGFPPGIYDYTYTQNGGANPCPDNMTNVQIIILEEPNPGVAINAQFCENDLAANSPFDLFTALDGSQDNNLGVWTDANGNTVSNPVDITGFTIAGSPYTFTYTIDNGTCDASEVVTISVVPSPDSGVALAPIDFCEDDVAANSPFDLFSLLDGSQDLNGTWYVGTDTSGSVATNPVDLTILGSGVFNYTYSVPDIGSCSDAPVTVQITINPLPNPGVAINAQFCENDLAANSPFDLFTALDGSQDNNLGVWTDANGNTVSNPVDITGFTIAGSPYTFTYTIDNGTCDASEVVTISVVPSPDSGVALAPIDFCEDDVAANSPFDLFSLLDGSQDLNGTWYVGTDTSGSVATNPVDLTILGSGVFNYTYSVPDIGSCSDAPVTVQITINPLPNPGVAINAQFCENDLAANSPFDLFTALDGSQDNNLGVWTDANGNTVSNPVDITGFTIAGSPYTFTYTIDNGTCDASEVVTISVVPSPDSGVALAPIDICEDDVAANSPFDLFSLLDGSQDLNGTWYVGTDTSGSVATNPVDLTILGSGVFNYTYSVPDIGTCSDTPVTVQITINPMPVTGTATPFLVCVDDLAANSPLDLFGQLIGNDAGGTWNDDDNTGALSGSNVDLTLFIVGTYNFTYSITSPEGCTSATTVVITVEEAANAGTATNVTYCLIDVPANPSIDLFSLLTGNDPGGNWTDDNTTGALSGSVVDITILGAGNYSFTYTVTGSGTCTDDSVTVTITINDSSTPLAPSNQDFCDTATVNDLSATGVNIQWYADLISTTPLDAATPLIDGENYFATQTDIISGCESSGRIEVTVRIFDSPNSGSAATPLAVCTNNNTVDLNDGLDGTQTATGIWQDTDGTGALTGNIFDASQVSPGTYNFTYFVMGTPPCSDASTVITVTVENPVSAGSDATLDICNDNGPVDLFLLLGNADLGGIWSPALAGGGSIFDPLVDNDGTFTYSISNSCSSESSEVVISVTAAPNAGSNVVISICKVDEPIDLFTLLGGNPDLNGTWSPALASGTGVFNPQTDLAGVYTYTVNPAGPCIAISSAQATVIVDDSLPPEVLQSAITFCATSEPTVADLNATVLGDSILWYDEQDSTNPLPSTTTLIDGEDYFASQTNTTSCESSIRVEVMVTVNDAPTPALGDESTVFCINDNPTLLTLSEKIIQFGDPEVTILWYASEDGQDLLSNDTSLIHSETYYAVLLNIATVCESSVRLPVTVDLSGCLDIVIPDGFSPNTDGRNDTFDIDNIDFLYPNFEMEIYNRYGNMVYKGNANTPKFDGTSNQSGLVSQGNLPVGVYFYILNLNDNTNPPFSGRLYLSR